jgi:ArsR family transcriptional regulator
LQKTRDDDIRAEVFQLQAELCKALAEPKRLMIIHELRDGARSVGELAESLNLKQSNTSQHLSVLRKAGLIVPHREGSSVYYSLVSSRIATACDIVREVIADRIQRDQTLTAVI